MLTTTYLGDESALFAGDGTGCETTSAFYDPSCRVPRKTHAQVAYSGYGVYRGEPGSTCTLSSDWNAYVCPRSVMTPMRMVIESMDEDHTSRTLVPVALASGGYVQLLNGGWDHQSPKECGGYGCLKRLTTFWATVAANRSYDLAFTATNPEHTRLMLPFGTGEAPIGRTAENVADMERSRLLVSIFYSSPRNLKVYWNQRFVLPLEHHMKSSNSYNFSMRKPTIDDPCGSNAFAAWENKIYVLLCGGVPGIEIKTVAKIVISLGIALPEEDFFDPHYLVRNLASLFGIPAGRMRVPKIVAGSTRRRLQSGASVVDVDIDVEAEDLCAQVETCGPNGACEDGECLCDDGWESPIDCTEGDCLCSRQLGLEVDCPAGCDRCHANGTCIGCADERPFLFESACIESCPTNHVAVTTANSSSCKSCHETCGRSGTYLGSHAISATTCLGPKANQCTACDTVGVNAFLHDGQCVYRCPEERYYADESRVCRPCSSRCKTCSGPRPVDCISCVANACSQRGRCPEMVFPALDVLTLGSSTAHLADGTELIFKGDALAILYLPVTRARCPGCMQPAMDAEDSKNDCIEGGFTREPISHAQMIVGCAVSHPVSPAHPPQSWMVDASVLVRNKKIIRALDQTLPTGQCVANCPHGQYVDSSSICRKCNLACHWCSGPLTRQCLDPTPRTPFTSADCGFGASRRGTECVLDCPTGQYRLSGGECAACANFDCETCSTSDPAVCHSCKQSVSNSAWIHPVLKADGKCHGSCKGGEFLSSSGTCTACDATCASCDGPGKLACTQCDENGLLPSFHGGRCLASCVPGTAATQKVGSVCRPCDPTCATCAAPADASACTACAVGVPLFLPRGVILGACSARCPTGEYGFGGRCVACEDGCTRCSGTGACSECSTALVLRGGRCGASSGRQQLTSADTTNQLFALANATKNMAQAGAFDTGFSITSMGMQMPTVPTRQLAGNGTSAPLIHEMQRIVIVGNAPPAPGPPPLPSPPSVPTSPPGEPSPPPPGAPPPDLPYPPPSPNTPLAGTLLLTFNGETTKEGVNLAAAAQLALGYTDATNKTDSAAAAQLFVEALEQLSTTASSVTEEPSLDITLKASLNASDSTVILVVDIGFHPHELVFSPLNLGSLPLISLDTSAVAGVQAATVSALQKGQAPPNMTFPEQAISLGISADNFAALIGEMTLTFDNSTTAPFSPNASATVVREALQELDLIGEVEVFREELIDGAGDFAGIKWTVRFYSEGDPPHIGPQPTLQLDASGLSLASQGVGRRKLSLADLGISVGVVTTVAGETPFDPADASDEAAQAQVVVDNPISSNETNNADAVAFTPVAHICGNGIRSTAEGCDDNNTAGGDGCSALCKIEAGFHCTSTTEVAGGSGIGGFDTCSPTCGDGKNVPWSALDECDDNNTMSGDGCSAGCLIEAGYACSGGSMTAMDTCASVCGDGLRVGAESCDDGNRVSLDGCNANCAIEDGFTCSGGSANSSDTCVTCHASCATCSGPSEEECVACASSHPFFSAPGTCLASCLPIAKYADSSNVCKPCDGACGTCSGATSSDCVSCTSASTPFLDAGTCVAECPSTGTYSGAIGLVAACLACDSTCKACGGPGSTDCVSCPAAGTPFFDAGTCVSVCPSGKYASANNACVVCDSLCSECSDGTATGCTNCLTGGAFDSIAGTCTYSCPIGQFLHSDGLRCANCDSTCRTCIAAGSCTSCDTGSTFPVYHSDACISVCPDGTHADSSSRCQACDASCATCLGGTATDCIACDSATPYKHGSTCLAACPTGSYAGGNSECATCDGSCAECDGSSTSSCTACPTFAPFLLGGACLSACPSTHYAESGSACGACDDSCVTCSGPGTNGCTSCAPATPHLEGGACACMAGYEATSDACTQVDECATGTHDCFGGAAHCTDLAGSFSCTCPKGYTGDGVSCVDLDECTAGTALCSAHATCANAPPSPAAPLGYMCTCNTTGYWGDGFFCGDVDECTLEAALPTASPHGCHPTARCINLDGAFDCACASGYRAYYGVSGYHNETVAWRL